VARVLQLRLNLILITIDVDLVPMLKKQTGGLQTNTLLKVSKHFTYTFLVMELSLLEKVILDATGIKMPSGKKKLPTSWPQRSVKS
jgi:hypothetical protein